MAGLEEVTVHIAADGTVRLEVRGVKGGKCLSIVQPVELQLGAVVTDRELTDEYREAEDGLGDGLDDALGLGVPQTLERKE